MVDQSLESKTNEVLQNVLKNAGKSMFAAALVPLAMAGAHAVDNNAARVDAKVTPDTGTYKYEFTVVNTSTTNSGKASPFMVVAWEMPLYDEHVITDVKTPEGWDYKIEPARATRNDLPAWDYSPAADPLLDASKSGDPKLFGETPTVFANPPFVVRFFVKPGGTPVKSFAPVRGFSFNSKYPGTPAPYRSFWNGKPPRYSDRPLRNRGLQIPAGPGLAAAVKSISASQ